LVEAHKNCPRNFDRYDDEGPIGAQIFGAVPDLMADAARILADAGAKWIDINMGCPVPKVATRANAGAYLMRDHKLAGKIMDAVEFLKARDRICKFANCRDCFLTEVCDNFERHEEEVKLVEEWLDYGAFHGFLQFSNGGFGKFKWEEVK
jgi:hypothetical protein